MLHANGDAHGEDKSPGQSGDPGVPRLWRLAGAAVRAGSAVEGVLGGRESLAEQGLRRVGGPLQQERQLLALGRGEITQHERGGSIRPGGRPMPNRSR